MEALYHFFTLDALKAFEAVPIDEHSPYECGYYDWADLRYLLIAADGRVSDGKRHCIFSNDPIEMVIRWMHKVVSPDVGEQLSCLGLSL